VECTLLAIVCSEYHEERIDDEIRIVLKFVPLIAIITAVFPPMENSPEIVAIAQEIHELLRSK
jgi:glycyl-tRNA synthetase (class II)